MISTIVSRVTFAEIMFSIKFTNRIIKANNYIDDYFFRSSGYMLEISCAGRVGL